MMILLVAPAQCTTSCNSLPTFTYIEGPVLNEVEITWSDWASVRVRLAVDMPFIEVEYTVGPIPQYSYESGTKYVLICMFRGLFFFLFIFFF